MLANPDIDLNVFRQQVSRIDPGHVSIFVARNDRALSLSSRIAGARPRLGAMDPEKPEDKAELDRLGVAVHDISSFSTDFIGHGAFAEAPDVVREHRRQHRGAARAGARIRRPSPISGGRPPWRRRRRSASVERPMPVADLKTIDDGYYEKLRRVTSSAKFQISIPKAVRRRKWQPGQGSPSSEGIWRAARSRA